MKNGKNIKGKAINGIYYRCLIAEFVSMQYQSSTYVLPAGQYGAPQYRNRVIVVAAAQGEVLPPMPTPSHRVSEVAHTGIGEWFYMHKELRHRSPLRVPCWCSPTHSHPV